MDTQLAPITVPAGFTLARLRETELPHGGDYGLVQDEDDQWVLWVDVAPDGTMHVRDYNSSVPVAEDEDLRTIALEWAASFGENVLEEAATPELDTAIAAVVARGWTVGLSGPYQHGGWRAYITAWQPTHDIYGRALLWQTESNTGSGNTPVAAVQSAMRAAERMDADHRDPTITEDLDAEAYKREEAMGPVRPMGLSDGEI